MPLLRPLLLPGLARSWRGPDTLQLGADPVRAVLIDLPDARGAGLLDLLDGSRSERSVLTRAGEYGLSPGDARDLIDTLTAAGFVVAAAALQAPEPWLAGESAALAFRAEFTSPCSPPAPPSRSAPPAASHSAPAAASSPAPAAAAPRSAPAAASRSAPAPASPAQILRRRTAARVVITGPGRLGPPIAVALAEAGVGHVHVDLPGAVTAADLPGSRLRDTDIGQARVEAVASALIRASPKIETRGIRRGAASLVIQLGQDQPAALLAAAHLRRRQPHLALSVREGMAAIGPLVPATGAPCLNCVDLHRRERDPTWAGFLPSAEPCEVVTLLAAAAYAAGEALTFLDGGTPETLGATVEITGPGRFRRRTWHPHPDCHCLRVRR